jgi:bacillithiol synthase
VKVSSVPFSLLSFSKLFTDYTSGSGSINRFFRFDPFSESGLPDPEQIAARIENRKELVSLLQDYNKSFDLPVQSAENILKLGDENSLAVVTGQQLTLFGGPLFTVYKVLTAIRMASEWEKKYKRPFIPVFWLADEDHDFPETASIGIPDDHSLVKQEWAPDLPGSRRVSEIELDKGFDVFSDNVWERFFETEFTEKLRADLSECYRHGARMDKAFGSWLLKLFGKYGLVLAGSNFDAIKKFTAPVLSKSILDHEQIHNLIESDSRNLENAGYHRQVQVQESNLFYIDTNGNRSKITFENGMWNLNNGDLEIIETGKLVQRIENEPERFSPNVFLRPLLQDFLLPTFAYVGGPSEVAYQAQMKSLYEHYGMDQPVIMPRFSVTLIESPVERIMSQLPFEFHQYRKRIEELEADFISQTDSPDLETIFTDFKARVNELTIMLKEKVAEIDPTLENTAGKATALYSSELDKLKGKLYRSLKQQEKTQLTRIGRIRQALFPEGSLQEREVAFIWFMNKYGPDLWSQLLDTLSAEEPVNHKVIQL